ncbi:MAG: HAD hydrolase family protein, partial [Gemmatimonadota bacterium]|nr:HAD hydrolase family protein [Gemmatimonadota bacterium]
MTSPYIMDPFNWGGDSGMSFTPKPASAFKLSPRDRMRKVTVLLLDVDGVLTDGRIIRLPDGQEAIAFDVKDGAAIIRVQREAGIRVGLISGRTSPMVEQRADELGIEIRRLGVEDKLATYREIVESEGLADEEIAYVGDDHLDLPVMERVGIAFAPLDASEAAQEAAEIVTTHFGGRGAVRDVCEMLIEARG